MLKMNNIDHVGIRISDRTRSVAFYELLGFELIADGGFDEGHPLVMVHPSGINFNLLGPATAKGGENVLMDETAKYPGITHVAIKMESAEATEAFVNDNVRFGVRCISRGGCYNHPPLARVRHLSLSFWLSAGASGGAA